MAKLTDTISRPHVRRKPAEIRRLALLISATFLAFFTLWLLFTQINGPNATSMGHNTAKSTYRFQSVPGYFHQDDPATNAETFNYTTTNFGLVNRPYPSEDPSDADLPQWQRFSKHLTHLAKDAAASGTKYKVLYLGRHGEGFHNVGEAKYGTEAWDDYWSKLDGDGELFWSDAHLTEVGKGQAEKNCEFLGRQFGREIGMPVPGHWFTSPLYRCLQTANLTYGGLTLPEGTHFRPVIKELMREVMGEHTCDRRSSRAVIHEAVPEWKIEAGFTEEDELWQADHRETHDEHDERTQNLLDDVFQHDEHLFLSFTSHSGAIASLLRVVGHVQYRLPTGGMMPVLIKATKQS